MSFSDRIGRLLVRILAWVAAFYLLVPLVVICAVSLTAGNFLQFPPEGLSLRWYAQFLADRSYLDSFWVSTKLAGLATAGAIVLGVPAALALARGRFRGRAALAALFLSPLVLPQLVIGAALLQYASALGFARTFTVLLAGHTVIVLPYVIRTVLPLLGEEQRALEEAAQDLGASALRTFFDVTVPLIRPGLIAGGFFAFIVSWINVELSIFNTTAELMTMPVKLFNYVQYSVDPLIAAVCAATIYAAAAVVIALDLTVGLDRVVGSGR